MAGKEDVFQHSWDDLGVCFPSIFSSETDLVKRVDLSEHLHDLGSSSLASERMVWWPSFFFGGHPTQVSRAVEFTSSSSRTEISQRSGVTEAPRLETIKCLT